MAAKDTSTKDDSSLRFICKNCGARYSSGPGLAKHRRENIVCRPEGWVDGRAKAKGDASAAAALSSADLLKQAARQLRMEIESKRQQLRDMDKIKSEITELEGRLSAISKLLPPMPPG